jgi:gluconolactonase
MQHTTSQWRIDCHWLAAICCILLVTIVAVALAQEAQKELAPPSGDPSFIPPDAKLELLVNGADYGIVFTEGAAVGCDAKVYFSDITFTSGPASKTPRGGLLAGVIWVYDPQTQETKVFRSPSGMSNGIKFDADCNMINAEGADFGGRRITRTDMKTGVAEIIAGLYDGKPFNAPNDISIDEQGRIYFSDPRYLGHEPVMLGVMAVYRIDTDGTVHRILADAGKPNGVAVSPDQKSLYVVSNDNGALDLFRLGEGMKSHKGQMALLAYNLEPDGSATFSRVLVDYAPEDGPDGLVMDTEGNLWVAVRDTTRPGIRAYTPDGEEKAYIPTPVPTNVGFGRGDNSHILYITAANNLYRIQVGKQGYHLPLKNP